MNTDGLDYASALLGFVDAVKGALIDALNGNPLGTSPDGALGHLSSLLGVASALDKYGSSARGTDDLESLEFGLAGNVPGLLGFGISRIDDVRKFAEKTFDRGPNEAAFLKRLLDFTKFLDPSLKHKIDDPKIPLDFTASTRFFQPIRRDPLTLDLDGDGLETVGTAAGILFDQTGSGVKTGTGWVKPDDGFLVLDRNGNGLIDSGRELFGDSTIKSNGQVAADGFDALSDLDSNLDGKISSLDTKFASLRVWRDLNQDGISQSGELFTLGSLNIASINVASTNNSQLLANGNQVADLGQFTRTDGTTGTTGEVSGTLADINLATDTFHRQFTTHLDTTAVANLPDMQGSGAVRDLREAASQSPALAATLAGLGPNTTRDQLKAAIPTVLQQWDGANDEEWRKTA